MGERPCTVEEMGRIKDFWGRSFSIIRIICFIIILTTVLYNVFYILRFKNSDGIYNFEKFYQLEDNSIDVLVLGSSHAFETFNTGYLYENYGIASYVLGGSAQPIWNTYYFLQEALETQKPRLIILEGYALALWDKDYAMASGFVDSDKVYIIKNTYGIKSPLRRLKNMSVSIPKSKFAEFLSYVQSHSKYTQLDKRDFLENQGIAFYKNWHGFTNVAETTPWEMPNVKNYTEKIPLLAKSEEYFVKILELAHNENIPIIVTIAPYAKGMRQEHQMKYNTVKEIAEEWGVSFINFNSSEMYEKIGLNFETDFNDGEHLNYMGNVKVSAYVADYILTMMNMPDRRGDPRYISWELDAAYINAMNRNRMLVETTEIEEIMDIFDDSQYIYFTSHKMPESSDTIDAFKRYFGLSDSARGDYVIDSTTGEIVEPESYVWHEREGMLFKVDPWRGNINIEHSRFHPENGNIDYLNSFYYYKNNAMLIIVYDTVTLEVVDAFYVNADNGKNVSRE